MLAYVVLVATFTPATAAQGSTLTGVVRTETGQPVRGASVFIRTAGPRIGVGHL